MATISYSETPQISQVRTTDAVATDVPTLSWVPADKTNETYVIEAKAIQENAANPLVWYQLRVTVVRFSGGSAVFLDGSDGAAGIVIQHGDTAWSCTMVTASGGVVKVQVTGAAGTNLNWIVKITRQLFSSLP